MLSYCDYVMHTIRTSLLKDVGVPGTFLSKVGATRWDLHPEGGYMVSTKKTLEVTDMYGKKYLVTVEEKPEETLDRTKKSSYTSLMNEGDCV